MKMKQNVNKLLHVNIFLKNNIDRFNFTPITYMQQYVLDFVGA